VYFLDFVHYSILLIRRLEDCFYFHLRMVRQWRSS